MTRSAHRPSAPMNPAKLGPAPKLYTYGGSRPYGGKWSREAKDETDGQSKD